MSINLESSVKALVKSSIDYGYHRGHVARATRLLKGIERSRGKTPQRSIKLCDEYAVEVFGHEHFAPWLYVYTAISGRFKEGWIPDNFYGSTVVPALKGLYGNVSNLKPLNGIVFHSDAFPDLISYVNGIFFDKSYRVIPINEVPGRLFEDHSRVVFKLDRSAQGRGIYFFDRDTFESERVKELGNGLFQGYVQQHEVFNAFAPSSVATLRVTTVLKDDGEVSVRACYLRLGSGLDTHVQSQSHVRVPIDLRTGLFAASGYLTTWLESTVHPTSKARFAGCVIPAFQNCLATVIELHRKVPYARCIGWDVTVDTAEKIRVMEWNAVHNDIKFSEATQGPCFADLGWEKLQTRRPSLT